MSNKLQGKRALVTGGSRGIGAAIAQRLAADGADVAITYAANKDAADATIRAIEAAGQKGIAIQADAGDPAAQARAVIEAHKALGGLDILVHNAGIFAMAPLGQDSEGEAFAKSFAVNVTGVNAGSEAAAPLLSDHGRIIIIGSINAHHSIVSGLGIYGATKAAVAGLARGWVRDLAPRGITVNVIQPGPIDTDMNPASGDFADFFRPLIPLGRYGTGAEVAALAAFLASDEAGFISGATIDIDGGFSA